MDLTGRALQVSDRSGIGVVRRAAREAARDLDLDEEAAGRAAIVATELATNVLTHGGGGWCFIAPGEFRGGPSVSVVAVDQGPGIPNAAAALADGFTTASTPGTGLGAAQRLSLSFDLYSRPGHGAVAAARVGPLPRSGASGGVEVGGVVRAKPGQDVSGDTWAMRRLDGTVLVLVADGLGHGPEANEAAEAAASAFRRAREAAPGTVAEAVHAGVHGTRGAAIGIAALDTASFRLSYAGIGNITGRLILPNGERSLVSMNGTAGLQTRSVREFQYEAPPGSLVVLHSDGVSARWSLDDYPGIRERDPALIAALLFRDYGRLRDDAATVVVRFGDPGRVGEGGS